MIDIICVARRRPVDPGQCPDLVIDIVGAVARRRLSDRHLGPDLGPDPGLDRCGISPGPR